MLDGAEALCLSKNTLEEVAAGAAQGLFSIKQLQQLIIDAPRFSVEPLPFLPWLFAQASKLEVLVTPAGKTPWLPPVATLKHLSLYIYNAVLSCTCLETLSVISHEKPEMGCLEMKDLPSLRVVVLKGINPESISVPKGCQLHIAISSGIDMQNSTSWQHVLANIHGIDVTLPHPDRAELGFLLNSTLKPLQNLDILHIHLSGYRSLLLDLTGFAQIKKLSFSGRELALRIPAGVSWDSIEVVAADGLMLEFKNVSAFTQAVQCFSASYFRHTGPGPLELCTALALNGIKCSFKNDCEGQHKFWFPAAATPFGCCCGACLECLIALGAVVADARDGNFPCRPRLRSYIERIC